MFTVFLFLLLCLPHTQSALNDTLVVEQQNAVEIKVALALLQFICFSLSIFFMFLLCSITDLSHPVFALIFQETVVMFTVVTVTYIGYFMYLTEDFHLWCQVYQEVYAGISMFHQVTWLSVTFLRYREYKKQQQRYQYFVGTRFWSIRMDWEWLT